MRWETVPNEITTINAYGDKEAFLSTSEIQYLEHENKPDLYVKPEFIADVEYEMIHDTLIQMYWFDDQS